MEPFPSNSHKSKDPTPKTEEKKIEKVVTGEVRRRKKPLGKRFVETFVRGDAQSAWSYVMFDVLIPAAKDMVADAVSQGAERMLYGETRSRSRATSHQSAGGYHNYTRYASPLTKPREEARTMTRKARATHDFDEIILATRIEAEEVLDRLSQLVDQYGTVSVADLYDLLDVSSSYTDNNWGWTDVSTSSVVHVRGGYLLDLPRPELLK